ncbi:MAG: lipase family protein [Candidatus Odinarchaeota archaeon]
MAKSTFSYETAAILINLAREAYNDRSELGIKQYGFELVHYIESTNTDTQCYIARDEKKKRIVIAFRGTSSVQDLLTDIIILQTIYPPTRRLFFKPRVHAGFLEAYKSVKKEIHAHLNTLFSEQGSSRLFVTGHSLGGALATIAAVDLNQTFKLPVTIYTYGSPKVGNSWFARKFNRKIKDSFRIANVDDVIPSYPPVIGYNHINSLVFIDKKGNIDTKPSALEQIIEKLDDTLIVLTGQVLKKHASELYQSALNSSLDKQNEKASGR